MLSYLRHGAALLMTNAIYKSVKFNCTGSGAAKKTLPDGNHFEEQFDLSVGQGSAVVVSKLLELVTLT